MPDALDAADAWRESLNGRGRPRPTISIRAPRERANSSGAGAFLALADDGNQYWVKVPGNPQGNQVLVNEVIVGELGKVLDAPVRERVLVSIPPEVTRWEQFPTHPSATPLLGHASLHVPGAVDDDHLRYTKRDDNARRQAAIIGLWDLCVGEDPQWLYETGASYSMWSYDHGLWFSTGEGDWDAAVLRSLVDVDGTIGSVPSGIAADRLEEMADALDALGQEPILAALSAVPVEWGTDDRNLEVMGWFLYRRRSLVADRLRRRAVSPSAQVSAGT